MAHRIFLWRHAAPLCLHLPWIVAAADSRSILPAGLSTWCGSSPCVSQELLFEDSHIHTLLLSGTNEWHTRDEAGTSRVLLPLLIVSAPRPVVHCTPFGGLAVAVFGLFCATLPCFTLSYAVWVSKHNTCLLSLGPSHTWWHGFVKGMKLGLIQQSFPAMAVSCQAVECQASCRCFRCCAMLAANPVCKPWSAVGWCRGSGVDSVRWGLASGWKGASGTLSGRCTFCCLPCSFA